MWTLGPEESPCKSVRKISVPPLINKAIFYENPDGPNSINPTYLLPLFELPWVIADRNFFDLNVPLGQFRSDFRFEFESGTVQLDRFDEITDKELVAGHLIGNMQPIQEISQVGEEDATQPIS